MPGTSWRDSKDLEGKADFLIGVLGEVRLADVLVAPSPDAGKDWFRWAEWSPALGFWAADREIKVSTHLAEKRHRHVSNTDVDNIVADWLTDNSLLVLATVVKLEQLACTQSKNHALIIFLEVVVHLRGNQSSEFTFRE